MARILEWRDADNTAFMFSKEEVHIWKADLLQPQSVVAQSQLVLSDDELERARRFKFDRHRRRFLVARTMLRTVLARYIGHPADEIVFEYETHGKPKIASQQNAKHLCFNLSHSHEMAVLAVVKKQPVGIDVEYAERKLSDADRIAKRFFSARESSQFLQLSASQKRQAFFQCWTRKEAFIKAIGEGLSHPLHRFDVAFLPGEPAALLQTRPDPAQAGKWTMHAFDPGVDYIGALVVKGAPRVIRSFVWQN